MTIYVRQLALQDIAPGVRVPRRFMAHFELPRVGEVELDVETVDGASRITQVRISEPAAGSGVRGVALNHTPVRDLLTAAVERASAFVSNKSREEVSGMAASATRRRTTDERLHEVAYAYREGGIAAVCATGTGERHAYRLIAKARKAGLLAEVER